MHTRTTAQAHLCVYMFVRECGCAIVRLVRYAIANDKGGAGKTTVALCLADALAARGRRVLMVDMDPQANLTRRLGYAESDLSSMVTTSEVVRENRTGCAAEAVIGCRWSVPWAERIDLVPSRFDLENRVPEAGQLGAHLRLARGLDGVTTATTWCSWTARRRWGISRSCRSLRRTG